MRRSIVPILALWLTLFAICFASVAQAVTCQSLPYQTYVPLITTGDSAMAGQFSIIRPESTTNLVTNPSIEVGTTGYTLVGSGTSIARSSTQQKRGAYSLAVTVTSTTTAGAYYGTVSLTNGQTYTFSFDVFAPLGMLMTAYFGSTGAAVLGTPTTWVGTGYWQRVEVTYTETSTTTRRLYVTKNTDATTGTFYIDGLQLENLAYSTTYCDGRQKGCTWTGGVDASTSQRTSQERSGGRKINIATLNAYLVSQQGTGMPTIENAFVPYASIDGAYYQRKSVKERSFTLALSMAGTTVPNWHINRQTLIDLIKPDLVYPTQPFVLIYDDGGKAVQISCYYDGGMELVDGKRDIETLAIRCLAVDPYWRFDGNDGVALTVQTSVSNANYLLQRDPSTATWSIIGSAAPNGAVYTMAYDSIRGYLYVAGNFTTIGGISATGGIARWDGASWTSLGTTVNTIPDRLTIGADGTVYADAFAGSTNNVEAWNGSSWSKVGGGDFNGAVWGVLINKATGNLYAWGDFTQAPGAVAAVRIAMWNGSAWSALGTGLTGGTSSGRPFDAITSLDGTYLYVAGYFTTAGGVAVNGIARWDGTTWTAMGSGLAGGTWVGSFLKLGLDGSIYLSGTFTSVNGITALNIARYNGSGWSNLGDGLVTGAQLSIDPSTGFLLQTQAASSGTLTFIDKGAIWNGSSWNSLDMDFPGSLTNSTSIIKPDGTIIVGFDTSGTGTAAGVTAVTNVGSVTSYPELIMYGPSSGTSNIYLIRNLTTNKSIFLNLALNANEIATLTLTPGGIQFTSNFRGNLMNTIRPGSELTNFNLAPGVNNIELQTASSTIVVTMTWVERCWSIDSSGV